MKLWFCFSAFIIHLPTVNLYVCQQFRGGAPGLKERGLPTGRKHDVSRPGRKPTLSDANHETVAVRLPNS